MHLYFIASSLGCVLIIPKTQRCKDEENNEKIVTMTVRKTKYLNYIIFLR